MISNSRKEYMKQYRADNKERLAEYLKAWKQDNRDKVSVHNRAYRLKHKQQIERYKLKRRMYTLKFYYGVGLDFVKDKPCEICGTTDFGKVGPCIDHDHNCCSGKRSCGKCIRGVLCTTCNMSIGGLKDDIKLVKSAVRYLTKYKKETK